MKPAKSTRTTNPAALTSHQWEEIDSRCDRFEAAWRGDSPPSIEDYLSESPAEIRRALLRELLSLELEFRTRRQQPIHADQYRNRFPDDCETVEELLRCGEWTVPTYPAADNSTWDGPAIDASGEALVNDSLVGSQFGDYDILAKIAAGGMGVVYKARQKSLDRLVALKLIRPDQLAGILPDAREQLVARFHTEAQAAARLDHDHVLTVYDVGKIGGQLYIAMRFVDGQSLRDMLNDGPLEPEDAARYAAQVADALGAAHGVGVLHRDIKPHNVMVERKADRALLADFGLAKLTEGDQELTASQSAIGSPPYMSPEQTVDSTKVTESSDVYGMGAMLYHLLTGRPPFQAASPAATMLQVQSQDAVSPRVLNPAVPRDLETVCMKCLSKRPSDRYASAEALRDELRRFLRSEPIHAKPLSPLQLFVRWYPKHASLMLGSYFLVTPMTWVFYILSGLLKGPPDGKLHLSSIVFLAWAAAWISLGYMIIKGGLRYEIANIAFLLAFALLPTMLEKNPQEYALIGLISFFGVLLQIGALGCRAWSRRGGPTRGTVGS